MGEHSLTDDLISALTEFSVGTLDGQEVMVVLGATEALQDVQEGSSHQLLLAMTPYQARKLAEGLLLAAESATMGQPPSKIPS